MGEHEEMVESVDQHEVGVCEVMIARFVVGTVAAMAALAPAA
jgi:hypothetical protein